MSNNNKIKARRSRRSEWSKFLVLEKLVRSFIAKRLFSFRNMSSSRKTVAFSCFLFLSASLLPNLSASCLYPDSVALMQEDSGFYYNEGNVEQDLIAISNDGFVLKNSANIAEGDRSDMSEIIKYTVERGDSLSKVAKKFSIDINTITWANNLSDNRLVVGQVLKILPVSGVLHTVKKDETLSGISKDYKIDIASIKKQNNIEEEGKIRYGEQIIIPGAKKIYIKSYTKPKTQIASSRPSNAKKATYKNTAARGTVINSKPVVAKSRRMIKPCAGSQTQGYRRGHLAIDIASKAGTAIVAAQSGVVVSAKAGGWNGGYGSMVVVDHGNGMKTLYAHLQRVLVQQGQNVSQGQVIGAMGNTGRVYGRTGVHLHFEVVYKGRKVNPWTYIK